MDAPTDCIGIAEFLEDQLEGSCNSQSENRRKHAQWGNDEDSHRFQDSSEVW